MTSDDLHGYERRIELLTRELDHRVKNSIAVILGIARLVVRQNPTATLQTFMHTFEQRVQSYKHTHELLSIAQYRGVDLRALLLHEIHAFMSSNTIVLEGEDVFLPQRAALSMGMIVHEMVTNAIKYGALGTLGARLDVRWHVDTTADVLQVCWTETGGPPPAEARVPGFGTRLIQTALVGDLGGTFDVRLPPSGFVGHVRIPMSRLRDPS